jgi:hypothetical protein
VKVHVLYTRPQDLVRDHDQQLARRGLLVRVEPPAEATQFQAAELELVGHDGASVTVAATVVQLFPGVGLALAFDGAALEAIAPLVEAARAAGEAEGDEPAHGLGDAPREPAPEAAAPSERLATSRAAREPMDLQKRLSQMTSQEKIQLALKGSRDERQAILRDVNKTVHAHVLKNPSIQLDEVSQMAKMSTVSPDLLAAIAQRREWAGRPEIASALVRNPKTPIPTAIKLLENLSLNELRILAKDSHTRAPIQAAARKRLIH